MEDVEQSTNHAGGHQEALWRERPVRNPAAKVSNTTRSADSS